MAAASGSDAGLPGPSFATLLQRVERDLLAGVASAPGFTVCCEPSEELLRYCRDLLAGGKSGNSVKDWRCVMNKRIGLSYKEKRQELVWLDDKLEQVERTMALLKGERHLPLLGHARKGDATGLEKLSKMLVKSSEPMVVKPRHGSNSKHVFLWPRPQEVDANSLEDSVLKASESHDKSWDKESWNQNAVPFLDLVLADVMSRPKMWKNTHPQYLWVARDGSIHLWDQTAEGFQTRHAKEPEDLPVELVHLLREILAEHWQRLRADSEQIATLAGLDEIRVDWLLGDPKWGPRIGELTYMGTFAIELIPVSLRLARAFAHAHLLRKGEAVHFACF
ncbi:hypothetical protein AK812_SmicGene25256 [Symbiodinium microadriaticum]|uniref:Uncharacterized protein n=1 Tax=Symbiodinium microadriaticum TaxID=2951 RepID=A0A1Q9DCK4_SYMMI|nr:hypothetical protein AK812_SmicGene25256 [Symbiodinium microadriaticum]